MVGIEAKSVYEISLQQNSNIYPKSTIASNMVHLFYRTWGASKQSQCMKSCPLQKIQTVNRNLPQIFRILQVDMILFKFDGTGTNCK
jgi:hypothetical protein